MFYKTWFHFSQGNFREHGKQAFIEHYEIVRSLVPPERLLEYEVRDGWGPLCEFLELERPKEEFPSGNDGGDFKVLVRQLDWMRVREAIWQNKWAVAAVTAAVAGLKYILTWWITNQPLWKNRCFLVPSQSLGLPLHFSDVHSVDDNWQNHTTWVTFVQPARLDQGRMWKHEPVEKPYRLWKCRNTDGSKPMRNGYYLNHQNGRRYWKRAKELNDKLMQKHVSVFALAPVLSFIHIPWSMWIKISSILMWSPQ